MHLPDTMIDFLEAEIARCQTIVDVEEMTRSIVSRFPGVEFDREQITEMVIDRASARGLAIKFAT